jgi:hypothetical protein
VILLKNLDFENELVNGARGLVVEFRKPDRSEREKERDKAFAKQEYPDVLFANGHRRFESTLSLSLSQPNLLLRTTHDAHRVAISDIASVSCVVRVVPP